MPRPRRVPPPPAPQTPTASTYYAVPQSPQSPRSTRTPVHAHQQSLSPPRPRARSRSSHGGSSNGQMSPLPQPPLPPPPQDSRPAYRPGPRSHSSHHSHGGSSNGHGTSYSHQQVDTAQGVQTGSIGGGYGPYSYRPSGPREQGVYRENRFSAPPSEASSFVHEKYAPPTTTTVPPYMWDTKDPDLDDALHNPNPIRDAALDRSFTIFSARGWANMTVLFALVAGLVTLFIGYPIFAFYRRHVLHIPGFNLGGINGSGQIPKFTFFPSLIDSDTPKNALSKVVNGNNYNLVFSDEFETEGRTFWPGDDPYWEAVDLHYWATGDLEWYNPEAVTTKGGKLVITMTEQQNHDLNFQSGMLTSWNKLCFTTGYLEVAVSLPGDGVTPGFWPAIWTMGNLGRAGYGATTEGMWPYTYDSCDVGTFPNQTDKSGNPPAASNGSPGGTELSYLPGQRLSSCSCPNSDHPGPSDSIGRGVPEIDVFEAQIDTTLRRGQVSQSYQVAPYDYQYAWNNATPATTIADATQTRFNTYKGGVFQEALSAVTYVDPANYGGNGYGTYAFEWWSDPKHRDQSYINWFSGGVQSWGITTASLPGNSVTEISQRLISEEPHYIIFNLGMSPGFQQQDFKNLKFPATMSIEYVRVYQREGAHNTGCNPSNYPTTDYINDHLNAYTNPNLTTWEQAGYKFPRNSLYDGC
ncbi:beta-glucan synthesis-associated [Rickenella mellea]|uniref:Beta-glucan synthesis-associated n=1 Tax=Rickenella mellea TaxID=50990 RepID=A0A4Y7Q5B5_9AGAM|nr:beta-glucan synthesis-associated [Rickenella mellea]